MTEAAGFHPFIHPITLSPEETLERSRLFYETLDGRRTVREYSDRKVDRRVIENCLLAASSAPSGAHKQPWHFAVVESPDIKRAIRIEAEKEEREFYSGKAPGEWIEALQPFGTDAHKPFIESAPFLIGIFARNYDLMEDGSRSKNYYVQESVGIATGMLITALHHCGLSTLTHTPSPMGFLNKVLRRPSHERAYILLVVGYPAHDATVPDLVRKKLVDFASFI